MFQSDECIHFVFADPNDSYFCPSGLILSFEKYLYLQLRKAQYREVLFLRTDGGTWFLEEPGQKKQVFEKTPRFLFGHVSSEENAVGELTKILGGNGSTGKAKTAVVMDLGDFTSLCGGVEEDGLKKLAEAASKWQRNNILVLCCPDRAEKCRSDLFENEVFAEMPDGRCLSPALLSVEKDVPNPFGQLFRYCRDKGNYLVLNSRVAAEDDKLPVKEQLGALAACLRLRHGAWQSPDERDTVNFLYAVMRSRILREHLKIRQQKFSSVYERLSEPDGWSLFVRSLAYWKEELKEDGYEDGELVAYLRGKLVDFEEIDGGVEQCDDLSAFCRDVYLPKWYETACAGSGSMEVFRKTEAQLAGVRRTVLVPRWQTGEQAKHYLRQYMQYLRDLREESTVAAPRNGTHLENIVRAAAFAAAYLETENGSEEFKGCCQAHDDLIRAERNYYFLRQQGMPGVSGSGSVPGGIKQNAAESPEIARRNLEAKLEKFSLSMDPAGVRNRRKADVKTTFGI